MSLDFFGIESTDEDEAEAEASGGIIHTLPSAVAAPLLGKRVRIAGLVGRPEMNGQCGIAQSFDADKGRYGVRCSKSMFAVKPVNLREVLPDSSSLVGHPLSAMQTEMPTPQIGSDPPIMTNRTPSLATAATTQRLLTLHEYAEGRFAAHGTATRDCIPDEVAVILTDWQLASEQQWELIENRQRDSGVSKQMEQLGMTSLWTCGAAVINALQLAIGRGSADNLIDNLHLARCCVDQAKYRQMGCPADCIFGIISPRGWRQDHSEEYGHRGHSGLTSCRRPGAEAYILNFPFHWMVILRVPHSTASDRWVFHDPDPKMPQWVYVGDDLQLDAYIQAFIADGDRKVPVQEHWAIPIVFIN